MERPFGVFCALGLIVDTEEMFSTSAELTNDNFYLLGIYSRMKSPELSKTIFFYICRVSNGSCGITQNFDSIRQKSGSAVLFIARAWYSFLSQEVIEPVSIKIDFLIAKSRTFDTSNLLIFLVLFLYKFFPIFFKHPSTLANRDKVSIK